MDPAWTRHWVGGAEVQCGSTRVGWYESRHERGRRGEGCSGVGRWLWCVIVVMSGKWHGTGVAGVAQGWHRGGTEVAQGWQRLAKTAASGSREQLSDSWLRVCILAAIVIQIDTHHHRQPRQHGQHGQHAHADLHSYDAYIHCQLLWLST